MTERTSDADRGFTLIEVVVVTVLIGLIATVIAFAITTVLRVTPVADSQVTNARSLQGLTAWFSDDAASVVASGSGSVNLTSPLKCANSEASPGANLVEFQWTVEEPSTTTFVAAYRLEPNGVGQSVYRYECSGSGSPPFAGTITQKLTGALANFNNVTWTSSPPKITLDLRALDGTTIGLEATPRSPDDTLPATTVPATLLPPTPCAVTFDASSDPPAPVGRVTSDPLSPLASFLILSMDVGGDTCGAVTIRYTTGDAGLGVVERTVTVSGTLGSVTIPAGPEDWTADVHTIEIFNNCPQATCPTGTPLDSTDLTVT